MKCYLRFFLFAIPLICCFSCEYEVLEESQATTLTIGSDYLYPKDSVLFEEFKKRNGTQIKIVHLSSKELFSRLNKNPYGSQIDLLLLRSQATIDSLRNLGYLHLLSSGEIGIQNPMFLPDNQSVTIGINPIVALVPNNIAIDSISYKSLSDRLWYTDFDESTLFQFYSGLKEKYNWSNTELIKWLNRADKNRFGYAHLDSTFSIPFYLTSYSSALKIQADTSNGFQNYQMAFPDKLLNGCLFSSVHIAMISQSPNYTSAKAFINFYSSEKGLESFNQKLNFISPYAIKAAVFSLGNKSWEIYKQSMDRVPMNLDNWRHLLKQARSFVIPQITQKPKTIINDSIKNKKANL